MIIKSIGKVKRIIDFDSGERQIFEFPNTVLATGRAALASSLAREIGDSFDFYVNRMIFGDGGTSGGLTKFVSSNRNGLFGITRASKPVIASVDPDNPYQVIFTSVLAKSEANSSVLNEIALQLATGDLYSMATFPDFTKTSNQQITYSWRISFL